MPDQTGHNSNPPKRQAVQKHAEHPSQGSKGAADGESSRNAASGKRQWEFLVSTDRVGKGQPYRSEDRSTIRRHVMRNYVRQRSNPNRDETDHELPTSSAAVASQTRSMLQGRFRLAKSEPNRSTSPVAVEGQESRQLRARDRSVASEARSRVSVVVPSPREDEVWASYGTHAIPQWGADGRPGSIESGGVIIPEQPMSQTAANATSLQSLPSLQKLLSGRVDPFDSLPVTGNARLERLIGLCKSSTLRHDQLVEH